MRQPKGKPSDDIRLQYDVERELADRLMSSERDERPKLYQWAYQEMHRRVPQHPACRRTAADLLRDATIQMAFLKRFLKSGTLMLEIGPGMCALSFQAAQQVKKVYGADVFDEVTAMLPRPGNFELTVFDGMHLPFADNSIDLAYSNQVIEHLHPDDALEQTRSIWRVLKPGGKYVCVTPNRITGPHDVSVYFDDVATCLHLKEYVTRELAAIMRRAGFSRVVAYAGLRNRYTAFPLRAIAVYEALLGMLPHSLERRLARTVPLRALEGVRLVGVK